MFRGGSLLRSRGGITRDEGGMAALVVPLEQSQMAECALPMAGTAVLFLFANRRQPVGFHRLQRLRIHLCYCAEPSSEFLLNLMNFENPGKSNFAQNRIRNDAKFRVVFNLFLSFFHAILHFHLFLLCKSSFIMLPTTSTENNIQKR